MRVKRAGNGMCIVRHRVGLSLLLTLVAFFAAGCGGEGASEVPLAEPTTATVPATTAPPQRSPEPAAIPSPSASPETPSPTIGDAGNEAATGLPGQDAPAPAAGTTLAVIGVAADDTLNVRDVPGIDGEVFGELEPLADDVKATGRARRTESGVWYQIEGNAADDGWVNARYVAQLGETTDITSQLEEQPSAETMVQLADAVARLRISATSEGGDPRVVITGGPQVGDLGEVVIDIIGMADDAIAGERLRVFAHAADVEDGGFTLRTVERTLLCSRGVSDGLCA